MSIYFYGCVTLDGCLADSRHGLDWLHETGTVEETGYEDFYRRMDVTLMGRRTFQALAEAGEPASFYSTTRNYVFTHRPLTQTGFTAVQGSVAAFVRQFSPKENLWVIGGGTLLAPPFGGGPAGSPDSPDCPGAFGGRHSAVLPAGGTAAVPSGGCTPVRPVRGAGLSEELT